MTVVDWPEVPAGYVFRDPKSAKAYVLTKKSKGNYILWTNLKPINGQKDRSCDKWFMDQIS